VRADRLLSIMMLLQTRGKMRAQVLADELQVSMRTVLRDVDALSLAGVPIYAEGGHGGGIALDENYRTTLTGLKEDEIRTLFIAGNTKLLHEIGLGNAAESSLLKLSAALPARHQSAVDQVRQRLYIDPVWWWQDSEPFAYWAELQQAVFEDRCIRAEYEHYGGEIVERVLEPYSLIAKASHWYLIARREDKLRIYRITRFHKIVVLDQSFYRPDDFDLVTYWHEHIQEFTEALTDYTFTLRLHSSRLNFVKVLMPGRHEIKEPPGEDGWLTAHFRVESIDLAQMLVFGLGTQAIVVEPESLGTAVLKTAQELLQRHTSS